MRYPIRLKLFLGILIPLTVTMLVCWLAGVWIINTRVVRQAQEQVRSDLNVARSLYNSEVEHLRDLVRYSSTSLDTTDAIRRKDRRALAVLLAPLMKTEQVDLLNVTDAEGRIIFRAANPGAHGDFHGNDAFVAAALKGKEASGTTVMPAWLLGQESAELARRAVISVIPTPRARPVEMSVERDGMMLIAASPVRDESGKTVGVFYGGRLLNGSNNMVNRIRKIVYEGQTGERQSGYATIFLDDIRISTNVPDADGRPAIGTRLSAEVYERVVKRQQKWLDRAFVVKEWYLSAYEPITDFNGQVIGALYVGTAERPFAALRKSLHLLFAGVMLIGLVIGFAVSGFTAAKLGGPIRSLESMVRRVRAGERELTIHLASRDEIGDLAQEFNEMTRALKQREEEISTLNRDLERKVLERTAELEEKNQLLQETQRELIRTAKLAELGTLSAGVAHEINNPLAIIRGNAELIQMGLPEADDNQEEVSIILKQVSRVEKIVSNLLAFARQERMHKGKVAVQEVLHDILSLVGHQVPTAGITMVERVPDDIPAIEGDADQLRQVFTNLIVNAIQAMKNGGILTVEGLEDRERESIIIRVSDTGAGIQPHLLEKIFTPFFTTRAEGTGMGLAISYGIVKEHNGEIAVESEPGAGTTIAVTLPLRLRGITG